MTVSHVSLPNPDVDAPEPMDEFASGQPNRPRLLAVRLMGGLFNPPDVHQRKDTKRGFSGMIVVFKPKHDKRIPTATITQVAETIQKVLGEQLETMARQSGFIKRKVTVTGSGFVQALVWHFKQNVQQAIARSANRPAVLECR